MALNKNISGISYHSPTLFYTSQYMPGEYFTDVQRWGRGVVINSNLRNEAWCTISAAMRKDVKQLHLYTMKLFSERKRKGLYAQDISYKNLNPKEKLFLKKEAQKLLFRDGLV